MSRAPKISSVPGDYSREKTSSTDKKTGIHGFGYDPVFEVEGKGKTYSEMTLEEKNTLSHRYIAFKKMKEIIVAQM